MDSTSAAQRPSSVASRTLGTAEYEELFADELSPSRSSIGPAFAHQRAATKARLRTALVATVATAAVALAGCGGQTRSVYAFCTTLRSEQQQVLAQFHSTAGAGSPGSVVRAFAEFGASFQAIGELRTYFHKLADVAPAPIEDDAAIVAQSYDKEVNDMINEATNPIGSIFGGVMEAITTSAQLNSMNHFALEHCHESI